VKEKSSFNWEISVGVTFASLMAAIALFFTGVLVAQYDSFDSTVRVPLLFLIISTFSYIFSASIYSNASEEVTLDNIARVKKYLIYANNVFEFLGLYLLIMATPLVIGSVTHDNFLRISAICVAVVGLILYSSSSFSMLHKEIRSKTIKHFVTFVFVFLASLLYFLQYTEQADGSFAYIPTAIILILFAIGLTFIFCKRSKQYR
jgi:hypothetical protein